jgi:hypothetical protein
LACKGSCVTRRQGKRIEIADIRSVASPANESNIEVGRDLKTRIFSGNDPDVAGREYREGTDACQGDGKRREKFFRIDSPLTIIISVNTFLSQALSQKMNIFI